VPADTESVVRVALPAVNTIVLFAIETPRPWSDTVLVRETLPANEFTLVAFRVVVPDESWTIDMVGGLAISWKSGFAATVNDTLRECPTGVPDGVLKLPTSTIV